MSTISNLDIKSHSYSSLLFKKYSGARAGVDEIFMSVVDAGLIR